MAANITMPKWGMSMKEGKVTRWLKNEGDTIKKGEPLFEVETAKITNVVEAAEGGILFQIVVQAGTTVPVGAIVAVIAAPGEHPEPIEGTQMGEVVEAEPTAAAAPEPEKHEEKKKFVLATPAARRMAKELGLNLADVPGSGPDGRVSEADVAKYREVRPPLPKISPLAEEMARQAGIDISTITGSGYGGKIIAEDVERALSQRISAESVRSIPFAGMRKSIAENMHASLRNTAQLTMFTEVDVTEMVRFRDMVREEYKNDESVRISYNDIIIQATARALMRHPILNATLAGDEILLNDSVHMGIAVALPEGLIVPVLRNAETKGLIEIANGARDLARKARKGTLSIEEVSGGTFTISNLSMFEVDGVTPILKPTETGILGIGRVKEKPAVHNGQIAIRSMMFLNLTFDHQVADGAPAAEFLSTVARYLKNPYLIMA